MADPTTKWPQNQPGLFFVDQQCLDCGLCFEIAPLNFSRNGDAGHSFLSKQPETLAELEACMEVVRACPLNEVGYEVAEIAKLPIDLRSHFEKLRPP